jgi:glycosyltransferase involved in cell wall biosynthesis
VLLTKPTLLCLSPSYAPDRTPTAIRAGMLLERCSEEWDITVLTESGRGRSDGLVRVEVAPGWRPRRLYAALRRLRLSKLLELFVWPDDSVFWVLPAILKGRRLIRELRPSAIVVFMMPYSAGLAGVALKRLSGLPLILNLDDSPTCSDMHPYFPSRLHYLLARALEDFYVRRADAVVYVSEANLERVRARQPEPSRRKLQLVRYGADISDRRSPPRSDERFEIVYVGAMSGWWSLIEDPRAPSRLERAYNALNRLGRYQRTVLDQRTSSPAILGEAILDAIARHPDWSGRVRLTVVGNPYPAPLIERALASAGVDGVVTVVGSVPHDEVAEILWGADLLFLTLPARPDGSPGGRISAKTYEYLATDRPILAAVPPGENRDYLSDKPGVWLSDPSDRRAMTDSLLELAGAKFDGHARRFDRDELRQELSYDARAAEFAAAVRAGIEHSPSRVPPRKGSSLPG